MSEVGVGLACSECGMTDVLPSSVMDGVLVRLAPPEFPTADRSITECMGRVLSFPLRIDDPTLPTVLR